jgi:hypothetical protein
MADNSLSYAISTVGVKPHNLLAKIGSANTPSIRLFESLGFSTVKVIEVFQESELRWRPNEPDAKWDSNISEGRTGPYTT